jgi:3-oxoacyl-[acyl-carrier protein] reductase
MRDGEFKRDFIDKKALVTGGSRGIGRAIVELLAAEGASVALCARGAEGVRTTVGALQSKGATAFGEAFDVRDETAFRGWFERSVAAMGGLDIVISNVSTRTTGTGEQTWKDGYECDLLHHVRLASLALPVMKANGAGSVVFIASIASVMTNLPPIEEAYGAMKAALVNYTGQLAAKHAAAGIRVNAVSPGPILFEGGEWDRVRQANPALFAAANRLPSMGRLGTPAEIANAVVFIASPAASYITGANLRIDGAAIKSSNF